MMFLDGTVRQDWKTKTSHVLAEGDIKALLEAKPDVLIVGTGNAGMMRPASDFKKSLKEKGVELLLLKTGDALKKLKVLREQGRKVGACLHIGC